MTTWALDLHLQKGPLAGNLLTPLNTEFQADEHTLAHPRIVPAQ